MYLPYQKLLAAGVSDVIWRAVSKSAFHVSTEGPYGVAVFDPISKTFVTERKTSPPLELPRAAGEGTIAFGADGLYAVTDRGEYAKVLSPTSGRRIVQFAIDHARGDTIVYVEAATSGDDLVLWESPYATSAAAAMPRKIASLPPVGRLVVNGGAALFYESETKAMVVRTADGGVESFTVPDGVIFKTPVWVDDAEVWLTTARAAAPKAGPNTSGMVRLARTSAAGP